MKTFSAMSPSFPPFGKEEGKESGCCQICASERTGSRSFGWTSWPSRGVRSMFRGGVRPGGSTIWCCPSTPQRHNAPQHFGSCRMLISGSITALIVFYIFWISSGRCVSEASPFCSSPFVPNGLWVERLSQGTSEGGIYKWRAAPAPLCQCQTQCGPARRLVPLVTLVVLLVMVATMIKVVLMVMPLVKCGIGDFVVVVGCSAAAVVAAAVAVAVAVVAGTLAVNLAAAVSAAPLHSQSSRARCCVTGLSSTKSARLPPLSLWRL